MAASIHKKVKTKELSSLLGRWVKIEGMVVDAYWYFSKEVLLFFSRAFHFKCLPGM
jgi:hypothetical protein